MDLAKLNIDALWLIIDTCNGNDILKEKVETEFQNRIPKPLKYSQEYIYSVSVIGNKAITIYFIPNSVSYIKFGRKITVDIIWDEGIIAEIAQNYSSKPVMRTSGMVKCKTMILDDLSLGQKKELGEYGFNTVDILFCDYE